MKVSLTKEEAIQLVVIGLESDQSPFQIKEGFAPAEVNITSQGRVSFELVEVIEDGDEEITDE